MSKATNYQLNEICELADETMQGVLQSHFDISEAEAKLVIENRERLKESLQAVAIESITGIIGRKPSP